MEQEKIKAVLEYLTKQWNEHQKSLPKTSTLKQNQAAASAADDDDHHEEQNENKIQILHFDQPGDLKGRQSSSSKEIHSPV